MTHLEMLRVAHTLTRPAECGPLREFDRYYKQNCTEMPHFPLNTQESVVAGISDILSTGLDVPYNYNPARPYWLDEGRYTPFKALITAIQFFDEHEELLHEPSLPPELDLKEYIGRVLDSDHRLTIPEQFRILLETTNCPIGSANLGFLASRVMARGADTRGYPGIKVGPNELESWNDRVTQFERKSDRNYDGPGDTYYFWTQAFTASLSRLSGLRSLDLTNIIGAEVMFFARKYVARHPTVSKHSEACLIGRNVGHILGDYCKRLM